MSENHAGGASLLGQGEFINCVAFGYRAMAPMTIEQTDRWSVLGPYPVPVILARSRTLKRVAERRANALPTSYRDLIKIYRHARTCGNFDAKRNEDGSWSYRDLMLPPG